MTMDWVPAAGLIAHARQVAEDALASGKLEPLLTDAEVHQLDGVSWLFYVLRGRNRKVENLVSQERVERKGERPNPFLPYDRGMEVAVISPSHVCLLNKFPVIPDHLLLITRHFESQDRALNLLDFEATCRLLAAADGLIFYNGGKASGASQYHKHLQWLPLPLGNDGFSVPLQPLLPSLDASSWQLGQSKSLPFAHVLTGFSSEWPTDPDHAAKHMLGLYRAMIRSLALGDGSLDPGPYNLLITRSWMLIVPRSREFHEGIGVNSMGYAGSMFVRDREQMMRLLQMHPLIFLRAVGFPR